MVKFGNLNAVFDIKSENRNGSHAYHNAFLKSKIVETTIDLRHEKVIFIN